MRKILTILLLLCVHLHGHEPVDAPAAPSIENLEVSIAQSRVIDKMIAYLKLQQRDSKVINEGGVCNGLAFLAQYYNSFGALDEFFVALETMAAWDGQTRSLNAPTSIPMYPTLSKLFDQWINDVSWFQQTYISLGDISTLEITNQRRRIHQYEMIKRYDEEREIALICSPIKYKASKAQLMELLEIWSAYPNTIVEFGGSRHATSSTVLPDGRFFYYDPNIPQRLEPYYNLGQLADIIQEWKYRLLGFPTEQMEIEVMAYQYVVKGDRPLIYTPNSAIINKIGKYSPNRFSPYHLAIYANDIDTLRSLLQKNSIDINQTDRSGITPLYLATQMWKLDFMQELLKHPNTDIHRHNPIAAAVSNYNIEAAELLFKHGAELFVTSEEKLSLWQITKSNSYLAFNIPAILIALMHSDDMEFVKELCLRMPDLLQKRDSKGYALIDYAIMLENHALYDVLIKIGSGQF